MTTLAVLTNKLETLCDKIDNAEELPEDLLAEFADAKLAHEEKVAAYVAVLDNLKRNAAYYSERAELLTRRAKACERLEQSIKERLVFQIDTHPDLPWKSADNDKLKVQQNNKSLSVDFLLDRKTVSNILPHTTEVPPRFVTVYELKSLNTQALTDALKAGETFGWARLESKGKHLRIY
jgi:hypothetical protein